MWFFYALSFAVTFSFVNIIAKYVMKEMDEYNYLFFSGLFTLPFLLTIVLIFYGIPKVNITFFLNLGISATIGVLAAVLAYRAIRISDISLIAPISAFNPVFTSIISFFALGERLEPKGISGILLVVIGAYLLQITDIKKGILVPLMALFRKKGVQMSLAAYFIWAITPIFEKTAILNTFPRVPPFASFVGLVIATFLYGLLTLKNSNKPFVGAGKYFLFLISVGILTGIGQAAAMVSFSLTNLGLATAAFKLSIIFTVILGWLFLKEKNIKERLFGSLVMLVGVILIVT